MTKHTPGPWMDCSAVNIPARDYIFRVEHMGLVVAVMVDGTREERKANARLIASSPTLYSLVQRAALFLEMNGTQRVALVEDCKSTLDSLNTIK